MELNGKKTARMLMRVSEDMAREVRALADLEHRSIQDQFRFLIASALQHSRAGSGNGTPARMGQLPSTGSFAEQQAKELPSTPVMPRQLLLPETGGPIRIPARKKRTA